jgi:hypothetical protein
MPFSKVWDDDKFISFSVDGEISRNDCITQVRDGVVPNNGLSCGAQRVQHYSSFPTLMGQIVHYRFEKANIMYFLALRRYMSSRNTNDFVGKMLILGSEAGSLHFVDIESGEELCSRQVSSRPLTCISSMRTDVRKNDKVSPPVVP